ncbi:hypothetical protein BFN03_17200 [Rhodococcus sp. WMMA185]|nr:hypothetical protein BFN03_17200 [Rhodococcus sp. WMMA185]
MCAQQLIEAVDAGTTPPTSSAPLTDRISSVRTVVQVFLNLFFGNGLTDADEHAELLTNQTG